MIEYKLSDILQIAEKGFKTLFGGFDFWGTAEILKLQQKGKYIYLELVEYDTEGKITAKVKGCIFDEKVCTSFLIATKMNSLEELTGIKILFHGYLSFHRDYGISIIINELSAEYTIGQLQKKQDDILIELEKMGILFHNKQLSLGCPPYTIALISGETSAGLKDFLKVIEHSGFNIQYLSYFCAINGNNAQGEVHEQLKRIHEDISAGKKIDAVALIRGGGGNSDIIWQNDLGIATEICRMPVPVIVAIGHTQDRFILQDLAWYGAKTPTDGAYKLIEMLVQWDSSIQLIYEEIVELCDEKLLTMRENIDLWHSTISQKLQQLVKQARTQIDGRYTGIMTISPEKLLDYGYALLMSNGEYMTKKDIDNIRVGESIEIRVYDKEFTVEIRDKK